MSKQGEDRRSLRLTSTKRSSRRTTGGGEANEEEEDDPIRVRRLQERRMRHSELNNEAVRIAKLAKIQIKEWIEQKVIPEPPVDLTEGE